MKKRSEGDQGDIRVGDRNAARARNHRATHVKKKSHDRHKGSGSEEGRNMTGKNTGTHVKGDESRSDVQLARTETDEGITEKHRTHEKERGVYKKGQGSGGA